MRILPEASVSAISPAFHLKARRVSYLRGSRLGVRLLFAFEPNRQDWEPPGRRPTEGVRQKGTDITSVIAERSQKAA